MDQAQQPEIRKVALFCKFQKTPDIVSAVISLVKCLRIRKIAIFTNRDTAELSGIELKKDIYLREPDNVAEADLAVIVGGDGTFIGMASSIAPQGVPMLGINLGRVGFLTDVNVRGMVESMVAVLEGGYSVEDRMMIRLDGSGNGKIERLPAVNDIVISRGGNDARIIELGISINGVHAQQLRADGIVFATPTGTTAYAMAAGGPIIAPELHSITVVPLNPYLLTSRPLAVGPDSQIKAKLLKGQNTLVHIDGREGIEMREGDEIAICRYEKALRVVHPRGYGFYQNLRQKLNWAR